MQSDLGDFPSVNELQQALGDRLRNMRLSSNLRQEDIAIKAGLTKPAINRLERGKGCTVDTLLRYCNALGMARQVIDALAPAPSISPLMIHHRGTAAPQRASRRRTPSS